MNGSDPFDAELRAAFADAEADYADDGYSEAVMRRIGGARRRRMLALGGAGAAGAALAATQLSAALESLTGIAAANGWLADLQAPAAAQGGLFAGLIAASAVLAAAIVAQQRA